MSRLCLGLLLFVLNVFPVTSHSAPLDSMLLYNVSFWRKELKLRKEQIWQIQTINRDIYETIDHLADQKYIAAESLRNLLHLWKISIYEVLTPRQKKRLEKLSHYYYPVKHA